MFRPTATSAGFAGTAFRLAGARFFFFAAAAAVGSTTPERRRIRTYATNLERDAKQDPLCNFDVRAADTAPAAPAAGDREGPAGSAAESDHESRCGSSGG